MAGEKMWGGKWKRLYNELHVMPLSEQQSIKCQVAGFPQSKTISRPSMNKESLITSVAGNVIILNISTNEPQKTVVIICSSISKRYVG